MVTSVTSPPEAYSLELCGQRRKDLWSIQLHRSHDHLTILLQLIGREMEGFRSPAVHLEGTSGHVSDACGIAALLKGSTI